MCQDILYATTDISAFFIPLFFASLLNHANLFSQFKENDQLNKESSENITLVHFGFKHQRIWLI